MKYRAVIFDLYGTLVENFPSSKSGEVLQRMAELLGVPPVEFSALWTKAFGQRMTGAHQNFQACIQDICHTLGVNPTKAQIEKAAAIRMENTHAEVSSSIDGALEVLSYLKENGYKTGLVSNCSRETTEVWPKTKLAPFVDVAVFSAIEGIMKPDPRIFRIALKRLEVSAKESLYIADGMSGELTTATHLGMKAVLVQVPHDSEYENDREVWRGASISSLKEIIKLLE
ncbi:MAG TPA: HAD family hydrolase [Dehalococcoidales bacterium]|nr:HAD family hydrolase [Dehalococcoidales bacterium]